MNKLEIFQSADFLLLCEKLHEHYLSSIKNNPKDIFTQQKIIIDNLALADFLEQFFAQKTGISSGIEYPLWTEFERGIIEKTSNSNNPPKPLSKQAMHWEIFAFLLRNWKQLLIPEHFFSPHLARILEIPPQYLGEKLHLSSQQIQRFWNYSQAIAAIFAEYIALRPDWLDQEKFSQNSDICDLLAASARAKLKENPENLAHYREVFRIQQFFWQELFAANYSEHYEQKQIFTDKCKAKKLPLNLFPERLFVFAPQEITAHKLEFLINLAENIPVNLYLSDISDAFISDLYASRLLQKIPTKIKQEEHFHGGQELLALFGKTFREQRKIFENYGFLEKIHRLERAKHKSDTLLQRLQSDILRADDRPTLAAKPLSDADESLQIKACNGLMRTLEIIRSDIITWLKADKNRRLDQILLLTPNISSEEAVIRAVFPPEESFDGNFLPARITGIAGVEAANLSLALTGIYAICEENFDFDSVSQYLLLDDNCRAYGLAHQEMQEILQDLQKAGWRRGFNAEQMNLASADDERFSFCYALDRLLIRALVGEETSFADERVNSTELPLANIVALNAISRFALDCARIFQRHHQKTYPAEDLLDEIRERLHHLYKKSDSRSIAEIDAALLDIHYQIVGNHLYQKPDTTPYIPINFITRTLNSTLAKRRISAEPTGVITIASLDTMRALPYKFIAFFTAENGNFPTRYKDERQNLIFADKPRLGDRNQREKDLSAFLQLFMSAEETLRFYYSAANSEDGEEILPPMPIRQLEKYLQEQLPPEDFQKVKQDLRSIPSPFSANSEITSPLWQKVKNRLNSATKTSAKAWTEITALNADFFQTAELPEEKNLDLKTIIRAINEPSKFYLRKKMNVGEIETKSAENFEPLVLNKLSETILDSYLIEHWEELNRANIKKLPLIPVNSLGLKLYGMRYRNILRRYGRLVRASGCSLQTHQTQKINIAGIEISANLAIPSGDLNKPENNLILHSGTDKAKHRIDAYLHHLAAQAAGRNCDTFVSFRDEDGAPEGKICRFLAVEKEKAEDILKKFLQVFRAINDRPILLSSKLCQDIYFDLQEDDVINKTIEKSFKYDGYNFNPELKYLDIICKNLDKTEIANCIKENYRELKNLYQAAFDAGF
ncbi:MAG: exodeoxyribonuclease V subunit gamma [Cardiobacteriaceae bacterium]|nr:exodeoxyribonuclease V subunit gamma [Cardiobacteriaceae bacterium]